MNETSIPQRKKRIIELDDALAKVKDGMTIGIGGFINSSHPMLVVRGLIKRGAKKYYCRRPRLFGTGNRSPNRRRRGQKSDCALCRR